MDRKEKNLTIIGYILFFIIIGLVIWYIVKIITKGMSFEEGGALFLLSPIVILILIRAWIIRLVKKLMGKESSKVSSGLPQELEISEVRASTQPSFIAIDKTIATPAATASREKFVANAYDLFKKRFYFGVIACLVYSLLPYLLSLIFGDSFNILAGSFSFALLYFFYISIQYLFFYKQFMPGGFQFKDFRFKLVHRILKEIFHPRWGFIVLIIFFPLMILFGVVEFLPNSVAEPENILKPEPWRGVGIFIAILFHVNLLIRLRKSSRERSNNTLLILRVFGTNEKIVLTFGSLIRYWQHFGTWFTIVDPSYLSPRFRFFTLRTLVDFALIFLLQLLAAAGISLVLEKFGISESFPGWAQIVISAILGYVIYILYWWQSVIRGFTKDNDGIKKKVNKVLNHPRRTDMTYKSLALFCYDNTWRHAVNTFIQESRVVLMDLRGFSESRKGCEYEIDFLFDTFPINRIIFLVDNDTDCDLVYQTILNRWEYLRINSPNLTIAEPVAKIFTSRPEQDNADVQKLIDLLIDASS